MSRHAAQRERSASDLVSWRCDRDDHARCSGVVAVTPGRDHGPEHERTDGFGLRVCRCEAIGCTCRQRADIPGVRATIMARQRALGSEPPPSSGEPESPGPEPAV